VASFFSRTRCRDSYAVVIIFTVYLFILCASADNAISRSELRLSDIQLSVASGNDDDARFPTFELHPQVHRSHRRSASAGPRGRSARPTTRTQAARQPRSGSLPTRTKYELYNIISLFLHVAVNVVHTLNDSCRLSWKPLWCTALGTGCTLLVLSTQPSSSVR